MSTQVALNEYKPTEVNMLVPSQSIQQVSPWYAMRVSEVRANPDPDAGDIFKVGARYDQINKKWEELYTPAKPLLMKVAAAAGIVWNGRESGPLSLQRDYVCWKVIGALRLPDGTWQPFMATKEIDLFVIEEEIYASNLKKALELASNPKEKGKLKGMSAEDWAQSQTKANMIQWRKNKAMRAETGAMLRLIRAALGMKSQYTIQEISKPFVVPRYDFNPNYDDPEVRKTMLQPGAQAMASLFGSSPVNVPQLPGAQIEAAFNHPTIVAIDDEPEVISDDGPVLGLQPVGSPPEDDDVPPWVKDAIVCKGCECVIEATGNWTPEQIAEYSKKEFGNPLCPKCQNEARKAKKSAKS